METTQQILCGFTAAKEKVQASRHGIRSIVDQLRDAKVEPVCFAIQIPDYYFWEAGVLISKMSRSTCRESPAKDKMIAFAESLWPSGDTSSLVESGMRIFEFFRLEDEQKTDFALRKLEGKMFSLISESLIRGVAFPAIQGEGFLVEHVPASSFVPKLLAEVTPHKKAARKLVNRSAKKLVELIRPLIEVSHEQSVAILTECGIGYSGEDIFALRPSDNDQTLRIIQKAAALSSPKDT